MKNIFKILVITIASASLVGCDSITEAWDYLTDNYEVSIDKVETEEVVEETASDEVVVEEETVVVEETE